MDPEPASAASLSREFPGYVSLNKAPGGDFRWERAENEDKVRWAFPWEEDVCAEHTRWSQLGFLMGLQGQVYKAESRNGEV